MLLATLLFFTLPTFAYTPSTWWDEVSLVYHYDLIEGEMEWEIVEHNFTIFPENDDKLYFTVLDLEDSRSVNMSIDGFEFALGSSQQLIYNLVSTTSIFPASLGILTNDSWEVIESQIEDLWGHAPEAYSLVESSMFISVIVHNGTDLHLRYDKRTGILLELLHSFEGEILQRLSLDEINGEQPYSYFEQYYITVQEYDYYRDDTALLASVVINVILVLTLVSYLLVHFGRKYQWLARNRGASVIIDKSTGVPVSPIPSSAVVQVDDLQKSVTVCCMQTARLGEKYCPCGKAIDDDMLHYYGQ